MSVEAKQVSVQINAEQLPEKAFALSFADRFQVAWNSPINTGPIIPESWHDKTIKMITDNWELLGEPGRKVLNVLASFGQVYPACSTLERMSRLVVRLNDVNPEKIMDLFVRSQEKSRQNHTPVLFHNTASITAAMMPLLDLKAFGNDSDLIVTFLKFLPAAIFLTTKKTVKTVNDGSRYGIPVEFLTPQKKLPTSQELANERDRLWDLGDKKGSEAKTADLRAGRWRRE